MHANGHTTVWGTHIGIGRASDTRSWYQQLRDWWTAYKAARQQANIEALHPLLGRHTRSRHIPPRRGRSRNGRGKPCHFRRDHALWSELVGRTPQAAYQAVHSRARPFSFPRQLHCIQPLCPHPPLTPIAARLCLTIYGEKTPQPIE